MTILVARAPLHNLSMSAIQSGSRRLSSRLQEKEASHTQSNGSSSSTVGASRSTKRKNNYEEDDDGFAFSRVKKPKRPQPLVENTVVQPSNVLIPQPIQNEAKKRVSPERKPITEEPGENAEAYKKARRKKMSFSTPKPDVRRSKRLSSESTARNTSPTIEPRPIEPRPIEQNKRTKLPKQQISIAKHEGEPQREERVSPQQPPDEDATNSHQSSTKISLPFADTPIIRRNKAMREGRGSKGDRRSSLGLRGRRASSLIETGNSNALPHQEVEVLNFYKHIESDMMEPRRMRQLLTWCATRAMHPKPKGTDFEDASAKSAARVIEEELLKELSNKSELSDWFSREDAPAPASVEPLPERPNPKNIQNTGKIAELEQQIERLRAEKNALEALLRPPSISSNAEEQTDSQSDINRDLLSADDAALLDSSRSTSNLNTGISARIGTIVSTLGPTVDTFADGVHRIAQYRTAADKVAGKVLSICATRLSEREKEGRRKALHTKEDRSPSRDLSNVLRGLSKADG